MTFTKPLTATYDLLVSISGQFKTYKWEEAGQGIENGQGGRGIHVGFLQRGTANEDYLTPGKINTTTKILCYN